MVTSNTRITVYNRQIDSFNIRVEIRLDKLLK